ncbi:MAG: (d)CMP kinase [Candidatus Omnitrophota bacterium]
MTNTKPIVAIDGPAGSGKSTVAKAVARKLGLFYIDTGAMYRALALKARREKLDPSDIEELIALTLRTEISLDYDAASGTLRVFLDGQDVSEDIRMPEVTQQVSQIARIREIRSHMVELQRKLAVGKKAILEGRDITTVVFPDAYKKFFLDARPQERVKRRFLEMKEKHLDVDESLVRKDIHNRDHIDSTRECAPLTQAPDAVYIDTTQMTIDQVVETVIREINR